MMEANRRLLVVFGREKILVVGSVRLGVGNIIMSEIHNVKMILINSNATGDLAPSVFIHIYARAENLVTKTTSEM